jgi:hypothetical protein
MEPNVIAIDNDVPPPAELPGTDEVGEIGTWLLPVRDARGTRIVTGKFLGVGSSRATYHKNHPQDRIAAPGTKCQSCRWFEPRIFKLMSAQEIADIFGVDNNDGDTDNSQDRGYLIHYAGRSIIPGEIAMSRYDMVSTAHEVVEVLTTRRADGSPPRLSIPAARVLAQAAGNDDDIEGAYFNRAVS